MNLADPAATPRPARAGGFTMLEVLIASVLLSFLILLAGVVTRGSMAATGRSVGLDVTDGRIQRALDHVRRRLNSASLATLEAAVPGDPTLLPMVDDFVYDNVAFRQVVGFAGGAPVLDPDPAVAPMRVWFEAGVGAGIVWFDTGGGATAIARGVSDLRITRTGKHLDLEIDFPRADADQQATLRMAVALVVP